MLGAVWGIDAARNPSGIHDHPGSGSSVECLREDCPTVGGSTDTPEVPSPGKGVDST